MIPNSETRRIRAEYEYNRRQFIRLKKGNARAWLLFVGSILLSISCIVLNRKYGVFAFPLVASRNSCYHPILTLVAFIAAWLLRLYSIQLLITIWKEVHSKDEYTPFVTNASGPFSFNASSLFTSNLREVMPSGAPVDEGKQPMEADNSSIHWKFVVSCFM